MAGKTYILGAGMVPFQKPSAGAQYEVMGADAAKAALKDAGISYGDINQAYASFTMGDTSCGQRALYQVGQTGIPIFNVNNSCASGSTALFLARQAVETGAAECVMALGFEQMPPGALWSPWEDRATPFDLHEEAIKKKLGDDTALSTIGWFAAAANEYAEQYGLVPETLARIAVKAHKHAKDNPYAVFRDQLSVEDVMSSKMIVAPLTKFECSPPTSGAAAVIICSDRFIAKNNLKASTEILGQTLTTDFPDSFDGESLMMAMGYHMARAGADALYEKTGIDPKDFDVVELHDCFASNEIVSYEALRLACEGKAEAFVQDDRNTYGGDIVANPSGGLIAKGHPIGATGVAQCVELTWQLRGSAGVRQVEGAKLALQHNLGIGGACVISAYASLN